jgi:hypothetical protein
MESIDVLARKLCDAYDTLGLPLDCPFVDVTKVYKRLAKRFHPDTNPQDPGSFQEMMSRINAAYATIKECHVAGVSVHQPVAFQSSARAHTLWAWIERQEREKKREEELRAKEQERRKKEHSARNAFWEKIAQEKKREIRDRKTYDVIVKYAQKLISFYYKMNFENPLFRARPYVRDDFVGYVDIYKQRLKRISALKRSHQSVAYRRKAGYAYEFLKSFIKDTLKPHTVEMERRSSALDVFQRAARFSDRFIHDFFSGDGMSGETALEQFKESLDFFDAFLKAYPESPLVEHAERKVDVLDKLYRGFMKDT